MDNIGDRIRNRRIELGYTQDEMAQKMGYKNRSTVTKMESSEELPLKKIRSIAEILEVSPAYLMGWEVDVNNSTIVGNNSGTISNNINSNNDNSTNDSSSTITNSYYSTPCERHIVSHDVEATINSKEYFYQILMNIKDMTDEQLQDVIKYTDFILNQK